MGTPVKSAPIPGKHPCRRSDRHSPVESKRIQGVLFDFDGTLTLPGALDFPSIKRKLGCPPNQPILEYLGSRPLRERCRLMKVLDREESRAARASKPNEGAETCLARLKREGYDLGILTRNSLKSVRIAFGCFSGVTLGDFAAVVTRDGSRPKPDPDGVLKAAVRMGLKPGELLVVGDFRFDVLAGYAAGALTALLAQGGGSVMLPGDPPPDYQIQHLTDIFAVLEFSEMVNQGRHSVREERSVHRAGRDDPESDTDPDADANRGQD